MSELENTYSQSEQIGELVAALAKAKLKYGEVVKSKTNRYTGSMYADLQDLMTAAEKPLAEENIVVIHFPVEKLEEKKAGAFTQVIHSSGQFVANLFLMPATGKASGGVEKLDAQTTTAAVTYAKRCNYGALVGLVGETDEDGNELADQSYNSSEPVRAKATKAPTVNQAPAKQGGERPKQSTNPVTTPTNAIGDAQKNANPVPEQSGVPKAVIPADPITPGTDTKPVESGTSSNSDVDKKADIPTKSQFDAYIARVRDEIKPALEKAGLRPSKGLATGAKLKQFILFQFGSNAKELSELTTAQWEEFFSFIGKENDFAAVVSKIEGGGN